MFGIGKRERALYERLLAEKDRTILALADEVDWHRAHSGTYTQNPFVAQQAYTPPEGEMALEQVLESLSVAPGKMHLSEDEEELAWQLAHGADPEHVREALATIAANQPLPFDQD